MLFRSDARADLGGVAREDAHGVAARPQGVGQDRPDEAGRAGDEYLHATDYSYDTRVMPASAPVMPPKKYWPSTPMLKMLARKA